MIRRTYVLLISLLAVLCTTTSCNKEARELKKEISQGYSLPKYQVDFNNDISMLRYLDVELSENIRFIKELEETIQSGFEHQLDVFEENELGFFASYKYMFNRVFLSRQRNQDLWSVKANKYFSNLELQQEIYNQFLEYNDRVKQIRFTFLNVDSTSLLIASMPEMDLPKQDIYLDTFSRHSLNNIIIEFGADITAWLLILLVIAILTIFGVTWTKGISLVATILTIIISVVLSIVNDNKMKESIRTQAIEITTINYEEILQSLNANTFKYYEMFK